MTPGSLLLLLGFLTLWAELTPVSGQDRPKFCYLPPETGPCEAIFRAFYYHPASNQCLEFVYGGCQGNANRFETKEECQYTCVEKPGRCPPGPQQGPCIEECQNDWKCPREEKCCRYGCRSVCKDPLVMFVHGSPTKRPSRIGTTIRT